MEDEESGESLRERKKMKMRCLLQSGLRSFLEAGCWQFSAESIDDLVQMETLMPALLPQSYSEWHSSLNKSMRFKTSRLASNGCGARPGF